MSTDATTRPGYCDCGEPYGTAKMSKALRQLVCRRCHTPIPTQKETR